MCNLGKHWEFKVILQNQGPKACQLSKIKLEIHDIHMYVISSNLNLSKHAQTREIDGKHDEVSWLNQKHDMHGRITWNQLQIHENYACMKCMSHIPSFLAQFSS